MVADASLWAPARAVRRADDGGTWLLDLDGDAEPSPFRPERVIGDLPHGAFAPMQLTEEPPADVYAAAVAEATVSIERGDLAKVVLARMLHVDAKRVLDPRRLLHRLRAVEPHCFTFAAPTPAGVLVGASPELLLSRRGDRVRSTPLAGTAPRSGDPDEDAANAEALAASAKNREEHAIVVEAVADVMSGFCDDLSFDPEPSLEPTATVWHLATRFAGTLRDPGVTALDIVAELHPTPAVCGAPAAAAGSAISALEPFDRGMYAGPVGWVDAQRRRRLGDRPAVRRARRRAGDPLCRCGHRRGLRPGVGGRRDRAQVPSLPRLAALGLRTQRDGRLARAARRVSPSRPSSMAASAACRPD